MYEDRCFINPDEDQQLCQPLQSQSSSKLDNNDSQDHTEMQRNLLVELELEDTNTNAQVNFFVSAQSQIVVPSAQMLETIREVAQQLLATSVIPFRREVPQFCYSDIQIKARQRLQKLGLSEFQIAKLVQYEVKNLSPRKKKAIKNTKNLVYEAETHKKIKRSQQAHHMHPKQK